AILFYLQLLRIWIQPPPGPHDPAKGGKATIGPSTDALRAAPGSPAGHVKAETGVDRAACPTGAQPPPLAETPAAASFDEPAFLAGAAIAYERVVTAYAEGNLDQVGDLLDPQLAYDFADALAHRHARREAVEFTLVTLRS